MNLGIHTLRAGGADPKGAAFSPHVDHNHVLPVVSAMWLAAAILGGCSATDSQVTHPAIVGMTNTTPPYYSDGNITLYEVQVPVPFPMRAPDMQQQAQLNTTQAPAYLGSFGATTAPWILASDLQTTLTITITNIDNQQNDVELLVDPWNEYVIYKPGVEVISDEETLPDLSGYDNYYTLNPQQRLVVTLVPDDTYALAQNLATVMNIQYSDPMDPNGNGLFNHTMDIQNRQAPGQTDPLIGQWVPPANQIPGMVGITLGLRSTTPMNIAVEVTADVQDVTGGKVLPTTLNADNVPLQMPTTTLAPPKVIPQTDD